MFNIGGGEVIVILLIALIVLGPNRLPDAARTIGKTMGELRRLSSSFQNEVRGALDTIEEPDRMASRRNVLAKEEPGATGDHRPTRKQPLVAAPAEPAKAAAKRAPAKATAAKKKAAPKNGTAVKKAAPAKAPPRRTKPS